MPKGTGWLVAVLVAVIAGIGGWKWYESAQIDKNRSSASADTERLTLDGGPNQDGGAAGGETFSRQQFGEWGANPPERQFEAGEVVVADPPQTFTATIGSLGFRILETVRLNNVESSIYRLQVPAGVSVDEAKRTLAAQYPGITLDANHHFQSQAQNSAEFAAKLPRALAGWNKGNIACGKGIRLGMIDAAVEVDHPALQGRDVEFRSFHRSGRGPGPADHGTAVASIMVGNTEWGGLLPGATLKAGNMFETNKTGKPVGSAIGLLKSINWLVGENLHAINFSVAGSDNKVVRKILEKVRAKNLIMIAAAGNWGTDKRPAYPAAYDDVVAVTAFGEKGKQYSHANFGPYIDFAAPGVNVFTAVSGGQSKLQSGTSFAAPFLTVLMALEVARGRGAESDALRGLLSQTTIDLGPQGRDKLFGWGYVNKQPAC